VWYSKYYKPGASEAVYREVIETYKKLELPLNVLVMDVGWHIEENGPGTISRLYS
jgi:alpha-glucosidase (family GH31 glycosyl hydrolase)